MKNPLSMTVRSSLYFALVILGVVVQNTPDIAMAIQTGDWNGAGASASATIGMIAGIIALNNLTPDSELA